VSSRAALEHLDEMLGFESAAGTQRPNEVMDSIANRGNQNTVTQPAPRQLQGRPSDPSSDLSLGADVAEQLSHGDIGIGIGPIAPTAAGASLAAAGGARQALNSFVAQSMRPGLQIGQPVLDAFSELSVGRKYRYLILCPDPSS
jgi:hypothetical protein